MSVGVDHSPGIEIRHLAALEAVAAEGSFRRAASRLGYVQSAISEQIAALERIVGQRLVERSRGAGRVELTEAGEILLSHAKAISARLKAAEADLVALSIGSTGSLRLGIYQSVGARVIPRLLPRYAREWPDVRVLPCEAPTDAGLFELVERGELELSFADMPLHPGPFESVELLTDPYVLLVAADSPLAGNGPVGLEEIARVPLIGHLDLPGAAAGRGRAARRGGRAELRLPLRHPHDRPGARRCRRRQRDHPPPRNRPFGRTHGDRAARQERAGRAAHHLALLAPRPLPHAPCRRVHRGRARGLRSDLGRAGRERSSARSPLSISMIGNLRHR